MASAKLDVRLPVLTGDMVVIGPFEFCVKISDAMPIRYPSTRARKVFLPRSSTFGMGVCQGDFSETVRTDVSRVPFELGSMIVTNRTGGPPPMGSTRVVAAGCNVVVAELLLGGGTVSIPGIWFLLLLLAVFPTSWPRSDDRNEAALLGCSSSEAVWDDLLFDVSATEAGAPVALAASKLYP